MFDLNWWLLWIVTLFGFWLYFRFDIFIIFCVGWLILCLCFECLLGFYFTVGWLHWNVLLLFGICVWCVRLLGLIFVGFTIRWNISVVCVLIGFADFALFCCVLLFWLFVNWCFGCLHVLAFACLLFTDLLLWIVALLLGRWLLYCLDCLP